MKSYDLIQHIYRQRAYSRPTFGPGARTKGVIDHIRKELIEIEGDPLDLKEWVDVILLALDGAWRAGHSPEDIAAAIEAKQSKNELRDWPDWRTADPNKAIEHNRVDGEAKTEAKTEAKALQPLDILCRNSLRQHGKAYPKSICYRCGSMTFGTAICANGID